MKNPLYNWLNMNTFAVVGMQWGDEGKGKIIDLLSKDQHSVVRAQGGITLGIPLLLGEKSSIFI